MSEIHPTGARRPAAAPARRQPEPREVQSMIERKITVKNRAGLHARPASLLVQLANNFKSKIMIDKAGQTINGKSIMGVIQLGAPYDSVLTLMAEGEDEEAAVAAIADLFERRFEEEAPEAR
jgi:phosphocarrier protein HPr